MAIFEWRKFNFFDLKPNVDNGKVIEALKSSVITCGTSGRGQNILCDSSGTVHIFDRNWDFTSFKGHDSAIILCALSAQNNLFVTVASEDSREVPNFKVWDLSKSTKLNGAPCLRTVKTALQKPTSLGVSDNGQIMAIGHDRGGISLYKGDIGRERSKSLKTLASGTSAITGIKFKQQGKSIHMFVCSDSSVLVYNIQGKDKEIKVVLDKTDAPTRCCALKLQQGLHDAHFMIGRDDAIYCYTVDGRGPCYALEGQKTMIEWFRTHLITITKSTKNISAQKEYVLTVIDIQNKFIVFTTPIDAIAAIFIEFGSCFIVTKNGEVLHLDEKDLHKKLKLLFKKNLYDIAIRIAKNQHYDSEGLAGIFNQYGNHLYAKGNYSAAIEQYIKTIGYLEPSYIIRRFLDSRLIHFLMDYLQALHTQGQATADHTTLLLNCFTRLQLTSELQKFLSLETNPDIMFDLDAGIQVCRNASSDIALAFAKCHQKHNYTISILIEDIKASDQALEYISQLSPSNAEKILIKYGSILMNDCPENTTKLLKRICVDEPISGEIAFQEHNTFQNRINPEIFLHFFVNHSECFIDFLEYLVMNIKNCSSNIYNSLIENYLHKTNNNKIIEKRLLDALKTYDDIYDKNHLLVLCRLFNFWPGILWIYEEERLYHLVVRYYLKNQDYNSLLQCCKRLGSLQPSLWLQALTGLRNDDKAPPHLLLQVLNVIAAEKLQSPLQVLNCLAVEQGPKLSSVRDYFLQLFRKENEHATQEEKYIEIVRNGLKSLRDHIENLRSKCIEFRSTVCDTCHQPLNMPAIYFLCQHSLHQDCFRTYSENDKDCSACRNRNSQLTDALSAQNESRNQHEIFHNILDRSKDSFCVVSEYLGRGLFNKIFIVDEHENLEVNKNIENKITMDSTRRSYGPGAEAKIRLTEGGQKNFLPNTKPMAEGRFRVEQYNKYLSKENTSKTFELQISGVRKTGEYSSNVPNKNEKEAISQNIQNSSTNPFGDLTEDIEYDDSKNPFANKTYDTSEYDSNLNPFD